MKKLGSEDHCLMHRATANKPISEMTPEELARREEKEFNTEPLSVLTQSVQSNAQVLNEGLCRFGCCCVCCCGCSNHCTTTEVDFDTLYGVLCTCIMFLLDVAARTFWVSHWTHWVDFLPFFFHFSFLLLPSLGFLLLCNRLNWKVFVINFNIENFEQSIRYIPLQQIAAFCYCWCCCFCCCCCCRCCCVCCCSCCCGCCSRCGCSCCSCCSSASDCK